MSPKAGLHSEIYFSTNILDQGWSPRLHRDMETLAWWREGVQRAPETTSEEVVGGPWEGARRLPAALPLRVGARPASQPGLY